MQSGPHGHLPADAFASLARLRVKEPARRAKLAIDDFRNKPTLIGLNDAVLFTCDLIKRVSEVANENLACTFNTDILLMMIDSVHKIVDLAKVPAVADSLGKSSVISILEKFSSLTDKMMDDLKSADVVPNWVHESSLENLRDAFLVRNCQIRGKLTPEEKMAHYFLFLLKGDLLRYKFNLQNEPYIGVSKAYWSSYCFAPEHGNLLKLLAIVALNRDRADFLGQIFYITRALSAGKPFEACTENLTAALGSITDKMVKSDYAKYYKFFENPSVYDSQGLLASNIDSTQPTIFFFIDQLGLHTVDPRWKRNISRLTKPALRRMTFDTFLHLMNMTIHKLSHEITWNTANMFICFFQHMLEDGFILGKEVVQLVTVYLYALSKRVSDTGDETYMTVVQTFVTIIGLLLAKFYETLLEIGDKGFDGAEKQINVVLPALVVIIAHWPKLVRTLPDQLMPMVSYYYDYSSIRAKISRLGSTLTDYLSVFRVNVKVLPFETQENDAVVFPEHIYATLSNRLATEISAFKLENGAESGDSLTFKTFLIRASLIINFMFNLAEKQFFGLGTDLSLLHIPILSTFELYLAPSLSKTSYFAVYPEFIVIDTNTVIDEYQKIGDIATSNIGSFKIVLTTVVMMELLSISRDENRKSEETRSAANSALVLINRLIDSQCPRLQLYNYYGERKFDTDFSTRDVVGLGSELDMSRRKDNNDDHIAKICVKLETLLKTESSGFQSENIKIKKAVLITEDKILRINARSLDLVCCSFTDFYKWFENCQTPEH